MKKKLLFTLIVVVFSGCSPKITSSIVSGGTPLPADEEVVVLDVDVPQPENAEVLGQIKIGDSGFTTKNGTYDAVLEIAREQARKAGGNVVKIIEHRSPDMISSIHRITASVLRVEDIDALSAHDGHGVFLSAHPDYAVVRLYREPGTGGALVTYDVHIGETEVYSSRPGTKTEVRLYEDGDIKIRAKTESETVLPLTVKKGGEYYVRTGVTTGVLIGRPILDNVPAESGKIEYEAVAQTIVPSDRAVASRFPAFRFSFQGGYSYRIGKIDKSQDAVLVDHSRKLRNGISYGADATWFFMDVLGVGLKFNNIHSKVSERVSVSYENEETESGLLEDNVNIWFLGPMASCRMTSENMRNTFIMNASLGYMGYKDRAVLIDPFVLKGGTLGYLFELGYDLNLTDKISLGAMFSFVSGTLTRYNTNYGGVWQKIILDKDSYESLGHINLSVGLRINL